jgi:hypothetical protein
VRSVAANRDQNRKLLREEMAKSKRVKVVPPSRVSG